MDIVCARTGRHFNGVEHARECTYTHDHCNQCPWDKSTSSKPIHFFPTKPDAITQQELNKLMADINAHLAKRRGQQKYAIKPTPKTENRNTNLVIPYAKRISSNPKRKTNMKHYAIPSNLIKLMLSLAILGLVITLPFLSYKAFTHQYTPINGSILVLATLGILIWIIITSNSKYKYAKPGFLLTSFLVLIIFLVTAFAGIQPMSDYKDKALSLISSTKDTVLPPSETLLIPYGTYTFSRESLLGSESITLTLNKGGTYKAKGSIISFYSAIEVGTYEVSKDYITFTKDIDSQSYTTRYRYSSQFHCLYLYYDNNADPIALDKQ